MKIAVVIVHFGQRETTKSCLTDLEKKLGDNKLIVVNNTTDDVSSLLTRLPHAQVINNHQNLGFAKAVNQGISLALSDKTVSHIFLLNNDVRLETGSFNQLLLAFNKYPSAGIVAPVLRHQGRYDWGGRYNKWTGMVKHKNWQNKPKTILTVQHVAGAVMLIPREVIEKIGVFDERFFLYFEDLDFCLRAATASYTIHINPDVIAEHAISMGSSAPMRTLYQWRAHFQFITKHLGRQTYPTAYLYDLLFYPLILIKSFILGK